MTNEKPNDGLGCDKGSTPKPNMAGTGGTPPPSAPPSDSPALPSFDPPSFNIGAFRLDQSLAEHAGGKKLVTTIPVRKPSKESWFRTHPDEKFRLPSPIIELKEKGETYLVARNLWSEL